MGKDSSAARSALFFPTPLPATQSMDLRGYQEPVATLCAENMSPSYAPMFL